MLSLFFVHIGLCLAKKVYAITDVLSKSLQSSDMTASKARQLAEEVCEVLSKLRTESEFDKFLLHVNQLADKLG